MMNDGQMSQEEIDALMGGTSTSDDSGGGGQMSQAEIDALMGGASASNDSGGGGQMSQAEIDALMGGGDSPSASSDSGGGQMSQAEIDALMGGGASPSASSDSGGGQMSQAEIDALMGGGASPSASSDSGGGQMSQAEIDALMGGGATASDVQETPQLNLPQLSDIEIDAMGEIGNISMGTAATTLSVLLGRRVSITTPRVVVTTLNDVRKKYPMPSFLIEVGYTQGITGTNLLTILEKDALIIANLMMGGDGLNPPPGLDEICMSAVAEAMNQMMGSTATSISTIFKKKVDIAPPKVSVVDFASEDNISDSISQNDPVIRVSFKMEVEDLIDSELTQIMPYDVGKELVQNLMHAMQEQAQAAAKPQPAPPPPRPQPAPAPARQQQQPMPSAPMPQVAAQSAHSAQNVAVQPVQFQPLTAAPMQVDDSNFGLIMDVPLQVTVELGRTKKLIKEILEFNPGSVVELDKLAGEPVDILVNGKLIAKGEVVVIDENFGVRITYICNQAERVSTLQ